MAGKSGTDINYNIDFRFKSSEFKPREFESKFYWVDYLLDLVGQDYAIGPILTYLENRLEYEQETTSSDCRETCEEGMEVANAYIKRAFPGMKYLGMEIRTNNTNLIHKKENGLEELAQPLEFDITLKFKTDRQHAESAIQKFLDKAIVSYTRRRKSLDYRGFFYFYENSEIKGYVEGGEVLEHFNGGIHSNELPPVDRKSYCLSGFFHYFFFEGENPELSESQFGWV